MWKNAVDAWFRFECVGVVTTENTSFLEPQMISKEAVLSKPLPAFHLRLPCQPSALHSQPTATPPSPHMDIACMAPHKQANRQSLPAHRHRHRANPNLSSQRPPIRPMLPPSWYGRRQVPTAAPSPTPKPSPTTPTALDFPALGQMTDRHAGTCQPADSHPPTNPRHHDPHTHAPSPAPCPARQPG
ncbi:hypothetical protein IWZ00DRAFT_177751 [Phyllosticta capitalensis]